MVYTGPVRDIEKVRAYYAKILPYFEREIAARRDLPFWEALASQWKPKRILEIGCGTGRVTRALSKTAPAVGIDISFDLLRRARAASSGKRAAYLAADLRSVAFARRFDLIVAASDPLCHLSTAGHRRLALAAVARQLRPGGRFVLDALLRREKEAVSFERRISDRRGELLVREDWKPAGKRDLWRATFTYREAGGRGKSSQTRASFLARAWDPGTLRELFRSCGLEVEKIWGSYSRRLYSPRSRSLIVVARLASASR